MAQRPPFKEEETEFFLLLQFYDQTDRNVHIPKCKSWISTLIQSRHSQKSHRIIILLYIIGSANSARASSFSYGNPVIIDFVSFCRYIFPFLRLYMLNALNVLIFDCVLSPSTLSCIPPMPPCMEFPFVVNLKYSILKSKWIMIIKSPICLMVFVTHFVSKNGSKRIICVSCIYHFYCSMSLSIHNESSKS